MAQELNAFAEEHDRRRRETPMPPLEPQPSVNNGVWFLLGDPIEGRLGIYEARTYSGAPTSAGGEPRANGTIAGNIAAEVDAEVHHLSEGTADAGAEHVLQSSFAYFGEDTGLRTAAGFRIIRFASQGLGRIENITELGALTEGAEAADTTTWSRAEDGGAVTLNTVTRVAYYDAGAKTLWAYMRPLKINALGQIYEIGVETRVEVDVPVICPT